MALTPQQIYEKFNVLFADNNIGAVGENDLREFNKDLTDILGAAQLSELIPLWSAELTFQTDGTDDGIFARHEDTAAAVRLWQTKTDDNSGNEPPTDPGITEDTNWKEVSPSANSNFAEWQAGVYGNGLIIVFYEDNFYKLNVGTRPYISTDIEAEIAAGDWFQLNGTSNSTFVPAAINIPVDTIFEDHTQTANEVWGKGANLKNGMTASMLYISSGSHTITLGAGFREVAGSVQFMAENAGTYEVFFMVFKNGTHDEIWIVIPNAVEAGDVTAPLLLSAEVGNVADNIIRLVYNEELDESSVPNVGDYGPDDGSSNPATNVDINGNTIDITLTNDVENGDTVTLDYTPGSNPIQDTASSPNQAASLTNQSVSNNVTAPGNQAPVASNVAAVKTEDTGILFEELFGGTAIDDARWNIINPDSSDVVFDQNNELTVDDASGGSAVAYLDNRMESFLTFESGALSAQLDYSASPGAKAGIGVIVDTDNYAHVYAKTTSAFDYVIEIVSGGSSVYSLNTGIAFSKVIKIVVEPNDDIKFYYWNVGTVSWTQLGTTQNVNLGSGKMAFISSESTTGGLHQLTVTNMYLVDQDYSTSTPSFTFLFSGAYDYSDPDTDPEGATSFKWYLADDAGGTNEAEISGETAIDYSSVPSDDGKFVDFEVTPRDDQGLAGTPVRAGYQEVVLDPYWFRLSTSTNEAISIGDDIKRVQGNANWNAGGSTIEALADGADGHFLWQVFDFKSEMVGLSTYAGATPSGLADIEFAIYTLSPNTIRVFESGSNRGDKGTWVPGDWLRVRFASAENSGRAIYEKSSDYDPETESGTWSLLYNSAVARPSGQMSGCARINLSLGRIRNAKMFGTVEATT